MSALEMVFTDFNIAMGCIDQHHNGELTTNSWTYLMNENIWQITYHSSQGLKTTYYLVVDDQWVYCDLEETEVYQCTTLSNHNSPNLATKHFLLDFNQLDTSLFMLVYEDTYMLHPQNLGFFTNEFSTDQKGSKVITDYHIDIYDTEMWHYVILEDESNANYQEVISIIIVQEIETSPVAPNDLVTID